MTPSESPIGLDPDPDAAFRLCVQFSQFTAKFDDGSFVDMPRKYAEWGVDSRCYKMDSLQKDLATKIKLGSCQQPIVWVYDMDTGGETSLVNDSDLSLAFFERQAEKRLHLFVDVQDNFGQLTSLSGSAVTEVVRSNATSGSGIGQVDGNNQTFVAHVIDWNSIEIAPCLEEQIGAALPVMDEDAMYEFLGLRDEDDRAEQARVAAEIEFEKQHDVDDLNLTDAELAVDDEILGERSVFYDKEDPPMIVGSIYPSMDEFRAALKQHAIKGQFQVGTEKSCKNRFRGFCKANGCHWAIVARLTQDGKHVRVTLNNKKHFCSSTGRIRTKMASYHGVAEKAIPILKKDPYKGAKQLKQELEDKYNVTLGYSTVWSGRQKAAGHIFGTWEESFAYLYNFKAEVELRMPGSIVEIDVQKKEDGIYFHRFFCCFKASIDGFLNGCRPYLSIDSTALNGRWNGHLPSATAIDGNNWMFPVAFGFFDGETNDNWTWFMQQLQKAIGNPPILAISSDACKAIANAVKAVFPWAEHRECFLHLMKNFVKRFRGPMYGRMYPAARTFQPQYHEYLMNKLDEINKEVKPWLDTNHSLLWMRSRFQEEIKCDYINNNVAEVWNKWVKALKDLPIADLADSLRSKFMELYARRRRIGEKFEGHIMLPAVVRQLYALSRELGHLKVKEGGRDEAEVTEITSTHKIIRHVVHLQKHTCTCREWQVSGKPCPHALALITTCRNPNMQEFLDPYFSVYHYRQAYAGVIKPLPDKSQWATVDLGFKLLPPLSKRPVGRQRKNRIPGCLEDKGNKPRTKGKWQVQCKNCFAFGHRSSSSKCHLNGTKKRKSRAKVGRPLGQASTSAVKRKKVAQEKIQSPGPVTRSQLALNIETGSGTTQLNTSPAPVTRSQLALSMEGGSGTSPGPVTRRQLALTFGVEAIINDQQTTPPKSNKSPAKKAQKKKLTPRKAKKNRPLY